MNDYRPIEVCDYELNDDEGGYGADAAPGNQLLTDDGTPNLDVHGESSQGLAAIAAALHKHAADMTPAHLEKAVWWLKDWKMHQRRFNRTPFSYTDFHASMERLKTSSEFLGAARSAKRFSLGSHVTAMLFGVCASVSAVAFYSEAEWPLKWGFAVLALFFAGWTTQLRDRARDFWQTQDRKYFIQCLRLARCTQDLNETGLFANPSAKASEPLTWAKEKKFLGEMRELQAQLGDALYFDWDRYMRAPFNDELLKSDKLHGLKT